jgi:hypothetical protein
VTAKLLSVALVLAAVAVFGPAAVEQKTIR